MTVATRRAQPGRAADDVVGVGVHAVHEPVAQQPGDGAVELTGDQASVSLTQDIDSGTFRYTATSGSRALKDFGATDYYNLEIDGEGGTFTLGAGLSLARNLTIAAGTFTAGSQGVSVGNSLTISGGTCNGSSGTLSVAGNWNSTGGMFADQLRGLGIHRPQVFVFLVDNRAAVGGKQKQRRGHDQDETDQRKCQRDPYRDVFHFFPSSL